MEVETFRDFLIRVIRSGKLAAGRVKPIYDAFYSPAPFNKSFEPTAK